MQYDPNHLVRKTNDVDDVLLCFTDKTDSVYRDGALTQKMRIPASLLNTRFSPSAPNSQP